MTSAELDRISAIIQQDPEWMAKFSAVESKSAWLDLAVEAARSHGVDTTAAEVEVFLRGHLKVDGERELSMSELTVVAGGKYIGGYDTT